MKKKQGVLPRLADRLELPEEAMSGASKLTVVAGRRALVENHKGILEYSRERITLSLDGARLSIEGRQLRIAAMNRREVLIRGELQDILWS